METTLREERNGTIMGFVVAERDCAINSRFNSELQDIESLSGLVTREEGEAMLHLLAQWRGTPKRQRNARRDAAQAIGEHIMKVCERVTYEADARRLGTEEAWQPDEELVVRMRELEREYITAFGLQPEGPDDMGYLSECASSVNALAPWVTDIEGSRWEQVARRVVEAHGRGHPQEAAVMMARACAEGIGVQLAAEQRRQGGLVVTRN